MSNAIRTFQMSGLYVSVWRELDVRDDEGTLVAYLPDTDFANLRCSTIQITKHGAEVAEAGLDAVREKADAAGVTYGVSEEKAWCTYSCPSGQDARDTVQYWYVGIGGNIAIISLFVEHDFENDIRTTRMRCAASDLVDSIRRAG